MVHRLDTETSSYVVKNTRIPQSCVENGISTEYDCSSLFVTDPDYPPASLAGMNYIVSGNGFWANLKENTTASILSNNVKMQLSTIPQFVTYSESLFLQTNTSINKIDHEVLVTESKQSSLAVLIMSAKQDIELVEQTLDLVPTIETNLTKLKSYFEDIVSLHKYSPEVRKIIWSSVGIVLFLITVIFTILIVVFCPKKCGSCTTCSSCFRSQAPPPPPPYQEADRRLPLLGRRPSAPPAEE